MLQCVAVCCSVLQCILSLKADVQTYNDVAKIFRCVAVCCSVLQRVAVCCSVLQCVAVCCSACCLSKLMFRVIITVPRFSGVLQRVVVCCSVLQCFAVHIVSQSQCSEL